MNENNLVKCFIDSVYVSENLIKNKTEKAIMSNKIYREDFASQNNRPFSKCLIEVEATTTFEAAKKNINLGKVAVLNFANPHYPGGGVQNGARAQEECLCRSSNLYLCISNQNVFDDYYLYNRNIGNKFFSDRLIYTKDVTVFKDDSTVPKMMSEDEWFNVDVITCAAPYIANRRYTNKAALKQLFKSRIKNIFESAIDNDVDVIILGAFGCGAFKNPPELVAKAFHEVIDENDYSSYFKKIVFAIKSTNNNDPYSPCPNIMAFELEFYDLSAEANKMRFCDPYPLEQAMGQIIMPSGKILKGGKQFNPYLEWKLTNKYFGKQFSILGDSISTLTGYNPKGYKVFYGSENCEKSGVRDMKDTWWGKVIDFFGGELLVNNSWSGSRVTRISNGNAQFPSGCSDERTSNLHINNVTPDVIIVYLGFNDWANGVNIYSDEIHVLDVFFDDCFSEAYEMMINKLKGNYPKAEIWCCTLNTTYMSSNKSFNFPCKHSGIHIEEYNTKIKDIAEDYDCKVIDLYAHHLPCDTIDGSHPNMNGMNTLATLVVRRTGGKTIEKFIDCENGQHEYFEDEQYSEAVKYICKKCGKIDFLCDYYDEFYDLEPPSKCSKCQGEIEKIDQTGSYDYYMCKECGNHICVSPFSTLNTSEEDSELCPYCGDKMDLISNFCTHCGKFLKENQEFDICPNCHQQTLKHAISSDYCTNCSFESLIRIEKESPYMWDDVNMNVEDIESFDVTFGDSPIVNLFFDNDKLTVFNRINGSRDGYMSFPDDFFDEKMVMLTNDQKKVIYDYIKKIDFSKWKTEDNVIKNYEEGACGFCINNSLTITFKNGKCFKCYEPEVKEFNQLVVFLKGFCDASWFEPFYNNENEEDNIIINPEEKYDANVDYIYLEPNITRRLFGNMLNLYDLDKEQKIEIQSDYIVIGRDSDCELQIDNNYLSQIHASFYFEDSCWFIMDKNSMNGTWLNGKKLKQNTKYELYPGDVINFAKVKEYVFYKTIDDEPHEYSEDDLLGILEEATAKYYIDNDDTDALKIIALTMAEVPIYFPMDYDFNEMFGNIDPLQLIKGDIINTTKDVKMKIITLQVGDEEIVPMFTSSEQANKGPTVNITRLYPQDYLPIVISMNKSFVLNPFGNNAISLKIEFLKDFVFPLVQEKLQNKNEIKDENPDDVKVGTVLNNRYELLKEIGRGGLSTVYLARDTRINKAWAVKIVKTETNNKVNQVRDSIIQEAQMMKSFNHPYIPKVADIINTSGYLAIVMDYVEGATLENIVKEYGPQSAEMVIEWAKQLCDVLGYLHSQNPPVIYRDMKPANIILKPEGNISIIDFGIMRTYKPNQKSDTVCLGTVGFAAPEQFGTAQTDCRSDIYALGMTMYNLYSGIRPNGNSNIDLGNKNDALSKGLISIIKKCTELSPDDRYQSCKELAKDLVYLKQNGRLKKKFNIFKK